MPRQTPPNRLPSGTIVQFTKDKYPFFKGDIIMIGRVVNRELDWKTGKVLTYIYRIKKLLKCEENEWIDSNVWIDSRCIKQINYDIKAIKLLEITEHIQKLFKNQHYYKKFIEKKVKTKTKAKPRGRNWKPTLIYTLG